MDGDGIVLPSVDPLRAEALEEVQGLGDPLLKLGEARDRCQDFCNIGKPKLPFRWYEGQKSGPR